MSGQRQADLEGLVEQQADIIGWQDEIIDQLRAILVQRDKDDREILSEARIVLSDWFIATYPHLYPARPQLRVIEGGGEGTGRLF